MLDNNVNIEVKEKAEYPPIPKNVYQVELLDVNSEMRPTYDTRLKSDSEQEMETVLSFQFVLLEGKDEETNIRGRCIWANFVPCYLYEGKKGKNKLMKIMEAFERKAIDVKKGGESISFTTLNEYVGKQIRVSIEPKVSGDKIFDNIVDFLSVSSDLESLTDEEKDKATVKKDEERDVVKETEEMFD